MLINAIDKKCILIVKATYLQNVVKRRSMLEQKVS